MSKGFTKLILTAVVVGLLSLCVFIYYNHTFSRRIVTAELISIEENNNLIFKTRAGEQISVRSPEILIPFLVKNKYYNMAIYKNKLRAPFLKDIKEAPQP